MAPITDKYLHASCGLSGAETAEFNDLRLLEIFALIPIWSFIYVDETEYASSPPKAAGSSYFVGRSFGKPEPGTCDLPIPRDQAKSEECGELDAETGGKGLKSQSCKLPGPKLPCRSDPLMHQRFTGIS